MAETTQLPELILKHIDKRTKQFACEHPGAISAVLRHFPDQTPQWVLTRCNRCYQCYRTARAKDYIRFTAGIHKTITKKAKAAGLETNAYITKHCRMFTGTVASDTYRNLNINYTVSAFSEHLTQLMSWLQNRWKGRKIEYFTQIEPQGKGAEYRLHFHMLIIGVDQDEMVWLGPSSLLRSRDITRKAWLEEINRSRTAQTARHMLKSGFWGLSDCQRVYSMQEAIDYVSKELNTSDIPGQTDPSPEFLDYVFLNPATGRRIRAIRYSKAFAGFIDREGSNWTTARERFDAAVPLWKVLTYHRTPPRTAIEDAPDHNVDASIWSLMRKEVTANDLTAAKKAGLPAIMEWINQHRAVLRAQARRRVKTSAWTWQNMANTRTWFINNRHLLQKYTQPIRTVIKILKEQAIRHRDSHGIPPWLSYRHNDLITAAT